MHWIHCLADAGFSVYKGQIFESVVNLIKNLNRKTPFRDVSPGTGEFENCLQRNPTVALRAAQNLTASRSSVNEDTTRHWFSIVYNNFEAKNITDFLQDDSRIFNCDETAFSLHSKNKQVLIRKGSKAVYNRVAKDEKNALQSWSLFQQMGKLSSNNSFVSLHKITETCCLKCTKRMGTRIYGIWLQKSGQHPTRIN